MTSQQFHRFESVRRRTVLPLLTAVGPRPRPGLIQDKGCGLECGCLDIDTRFDGCATHSVNAGRVELFMWQHCPSDRHATQTRTMRADKARRPRSSWSIHGSLRGCPCISPSQYCKYGTGRLGHGKRRLVSSKARTLSPIERMVNTLMFCLRPSRRSSPGSQYMFIASARRGRGEKRLNYDRNLTQRLSHGAKVSRRKSLLVNGAASG